MSLKIQTSIPDGCKDAFAKWEAIYGSRSSAAQDLILRGMESVGLWPPKIDPAPTQPVQQGANPQ